MIWMTLCLSSFLGRMMWNMMLRRICMFSLMVWWNLNFIVAIMTARMLLLSCFRNISSIWSFVVLCFMMIWFCTLWFWMRLMSALLWLWLRIILTLMWIRILGKFRLKNFWGLCRFSMRVVLPFFVLMVDCTHNFFPKFSWLRIGMMWVVWWVFLSLGMIVIINLSINWSYCNSRNTGYKKEDRNSQQDTLHWI